MIALRPRRVDWLIGTTVLASLLAVWIMIAGLDALLQFLRQLGHVGKNGFTLADAALYVLVTFPRRWAAWPAAVSSPRCAPRACRSCASPRRRPVWWRCSSWAW
jgi:hypothetical protein